MLKLELNHIFLDCKHLKLTEITSALSIDNTWGNGSYNSNLPKNKWKYLYDNDTYAIFSVILNFPDSYTTKNLFDNINPVLPFANTLSNFYNRVKIDTTNVVEVDNIRKLKYVEGGTAIDFDKDDIYWLVRRVTDTIDYGYQADFRLVYAGIDGKSNLDIVNNYLLTGDITGTVFYADFLGVSKFSVNFEYSSILTLKVPYNEESVNLSSKWNDYLDGTISEFILTSNDLVLSNSNYLVDFPDGIYIFTWTIPYLEYTIDICFDSTKKYLPIAYKILSLCSIQCCINNAIMKIANIIDCDNCDKEAINKIYDLKLLYDSMIAAFQCGNYNTVKISLNLINKLCNFNECNNC